MDATAKPSVIVYGPQGCGKTRMAEVMRQHFLLDRVYDRDGPPLSSHRQLPKTGHLILTNEQPPKSCRNAMSFDQAMRLVRTQPARNPYG